MCGSRLANATCAIPTRRLQGPFCAGCCHHKRDPVNPQSTRKALAQGQLSSNSPQEKRNTRSKNTCRAHTQPHQPGVHAAESASCLPRPRQLPGWCRGFLQVQCLRWSLARATSRTLRSQQTLPPLHGRQPMPPQQLREVSGPTSWAAAAPFWPVLLQSWPSALAVGQAGHGGSVP